MKLTLNMNSNEANATMNTIISGAKELGFEPDVTVYDAGSEICKCAAADTTKNFPGGAARIFMADAGDDVRDYTMAIEVKDDAYIEAMSIALKLTRYIAPTVHAAKALLGTLKSVNKGLSDAYAGMVANYRKQFVPAKKYAVATVFNMDLDLAAKVLVEDDGLGNIRVVTIKNVGKEYDTDVYMALFTTAYENGEATKNSMTERYPEIVFNKVPLSEALKELEDIKGVQADYDGMQRMKKERRATSK